MGMAVLQIVLYNLDTFTRLSVLTAILVLQTAIYVLITLAVLHVNL